MAALMIIMLSLCEISNVGIANNVRDTNFESVKSLESDFAQGVSKKKNTLTQKTLITFQIMVVPYIRQLIYGF
jgi:hypothetical protein